MKAEAYLVYKREVPNTRDTFLYALAYMRSIKIKMSSTLYHPSVAYLKVSIDVLPTQDIDSACPGEASPRIAFIVLCCNDITTSHFCT